MRRSLKSKLGVARILVLLFETFFKLKKKYKRCFIPRIIDDQDFLKGQKESNFIQNNISRTYECK